MEARLTCFNKRDTCTLPKLKTETQNTSASPATQRSLKKKKRKEILHADPYASLLFWSFIFPQRRMAIRCMAKLHLSFQYEWPCTFGAAGATEMWNCEWHAEWPRHAGLIQTAFDVCLRVKWAAGPEFTQALARSQVHVLIIGPKTQRARSRSQVYPTSREALGTYGNLCNTNKKFYCCVSASKKIQCSVQDLTPEHSQTFTRIAFTRQWELSCL